MWLVLPSSQSSFIFYRTPLSPPPPCISVSLFLYAFCLFVCLLLLLFLFLLVVESYPILCEQFAVVFYQHPVTVVTLRTAYFAGWSRTRMTRQAANGSSSTPHGPGSMTSLSVTTQVTITTFPFLCIHLPVIINSIVFLG